MASRPAPVVSGVSRWLIARITVIPHDDWDGELGELYPRVMDST